MSNSKLPNFLLYIGLLGASAHFVALEATPGQDLSGQDLTVGDTVSVDWTGEDWSGGTYNQTFFSTTQQPGIFVNTDFSSSEFDQGVFSDANLNGANFSSSTGFSLSMFLDVWDARGVQLQGLDFTETFFYGRGDSRNEHDLCA